MIMNRIFRQSAVCLITAMTGVLLITGCGGKTENTSNSGQTSQKEEIQIEETQKGNTEQKIQTGEEVQTTDKTEETAENAIVSDMSNVSIDYKVSELYSEEDMDLAIEEIEKEFGTWEGCVLYSISYTDDTKCTDNLSYINTLAVDTEYDECIVFTSNFHSPVEGGGAWEPDYDYENWEWYLGRTEGGNWDLLTWGY